MRRRISQFFALGALLIFTHTAQAKLLVKMDEPTRAGKKTVIKLSLKNTFAKKVESARATIFVFDEQDKIVSQSTQWVVGGAEDKPARAPDASTTYNFVLPSDKPFTKTKLIFNRIVLEGGKQVDPSKNAVIEQSN